MGTAGSSNPVATLKSTDDDRPVRQISRLRFDALAAYACPPLAAMVSVEIAWFEWPASRLIAALLVVSDDGYSAVVLAPDLRERFRWVAMTGFHSSPEDVLPELAAR